MTTKRQIHFLMFQFLWRLPILRLQVGVITFGGFEVEVV